MSNRVLTLFKLNESNSQLSFRFRGENEINIANVLECVLDDTGRAKELILDRLIHKPNEDGFFIYDNDKFNSSVNVYGSIATELTIGALATELN